MQDAYCPDACIEPHGRVYASRLFTQQHYTTTEPIIYNEVNAVIQYEVANTAKPEST